MNDVMYLHAWHCVIFEVEWMMYLLGCDDPFTWVYNTLMLEIDDLQDNKYTKYLVS